MGGVASAIGGLFGGASAPAPQMAQVISPVTQAQATDQYNQTQGVLGSQQQLANQLAAQNGIQNQSNVYNALQNVAQGTGPNPAQAMLNNATGANTANQAALMASQRGASANPGQIARLAAQQGAANQQNAVGQGAALQAQQSLGALGQQGALANQMVSNQMGQNATLGNQNIAEQQNLLNSIQGANTANVANASQYNTANNTYRQQGQTGLGSLLGGISSALPGIGSTIGGIFGGGGQQQEQAPQTTDYTTLGNADLMYGAKGGVVDPVGQIYYGMACGGSVMNQGGMLDGEAHAKTMEPVPGKAKVKGDSLKNDVVPAKLSPGEIIIPKSVMESKDPLKEGTKFLAKALRKSGKKGSEDSDFKSALKRAAGARK
jgi:hypothetical protein